MLLQQLSNSRLDRHDRVVPSNSDICSRSHGIIHDLQRKVTVVFPISCTSFNLISPVLQHCDPANF